MKIKYVVTILLSLLAACGAGASIVRPVGECAKGAVLTADGLQVEGFLCPKSNMDICECKPLEGKQLVKLGEALKTTFGVINGGDFKAHVRADRKWLPFASAGKPMDGNGVLEKYPVLIPPFRIVIVDDKAGERAHTSFSPAQITTYGAVLLDWDFDERKPALINTLAHEMSHLISENHGGSPDYAFTDAGFSGHPCEQVNLVSYKIGHMAQCTFAKRQGQDFNDCVDRLHHEMAIPWYTIPWAWWRHFCPKYQ